MSANFGDWRLNDCWWTNEEYDSAKAEQLYAIRETGCSCMYDFWVVNNGTPAATLEQQVTWTSPGCPLHGEQGAIKKTSK